MRPSRHVVGALAPRSWKRPSHTFPRVAVRSCSAMPELKPNDPKVIARLLRAIAGGTDAKKSKQDIILNVAADMLEKYDDDASRCHMSNRAEA